MLAGGSNINLYSAGTGDLLYKTIFVNRNDWLITDSSDRFDGTEAARKLLYFTCNNEIIELDQVKDQLWVPDLAQRITKGDSITGKTLKDLDICGLTPVMQDRSAGNNYHFIITPRRGGLGETALMVNGIEVKRFTQAQLEKNGEAFELKLSKEE